MKEFVKKVYSNIESKNYSELADIITIRIKVNLPNRVGVFHSVPPTILNSLSGAAVCH